MKKETWEQKDRRLLGRRLDRLFTKVTRGWSLAWRREFLRDIAKAITRKKKAGL